MARGFESKDVEFQQSEAERRSTSRSPVESNGGPAALATREQRDRAAVRRGLELTIVRVRHDLAAATSAAHRRMLEQALADLDRQLSAALTVTG